MTSKLYIGVALAVMASAIISVAGPSTGYYPKSVSFPPSRCNDSDLITWVAASNAWLCRSVSGAGGVTTVAGTAPLASSCTSGTCTVSAPAGGTFDMATLKIGGVIAMGPSHTGTIDVGAYKYNGTLVIGPSGPLYSGPSSVTLTHTDVTGGNVALTTEGTIDWMRITTTNVLQCAAAQVPRKLHTPGAFTCDSVQLISSNSTATNGTDNTITYTASDGIDATTSGNTSYIARVSTSPAVGYGFVVTIGGVTPSTRVARIYWSEFSEPQTTCTATLPDGTTVSDVVSGTSGVANGFESTITYSSVIPGAVNLTCIVTNGSGSGSPAIGPRAMTLGVI